MALHEFNYEKEATVSIVKSILTDAIKMKASDIHFDPEPNNLLIRFRINGDLIEYTTAPESVKANITTRLKIISGMNITEATIPQFGSINFELSSKTHNMRTVSIPVADGEKIVVHLSNYAKGFKSLNNLGFTKENVNKILEMLNEEEGIILITGVSSSGKTTSMYAILQELSKKPLNIISVENPIKMKISGINQVQINNEKGITYNNILKSILLSDPDVIAINELINDETIRTALRASITGRLVISTMHTKTPFTTIKSLLNMDLESYLLGSNLNGIISQRLIKKLCPTCREKIKATTFEKKVIKEVLDKDVDELYIPKGCEECQDGFVEQIPIVEVVKLSDELRQAISNHRNEELIYNIINSENDSIIKDAFKKVLNGDTSFAEAIKIIDIKSDLGNKDSKLKNLLLGKDIEDEESNESNNIENENTSEITNKKDEEKEISHNEEVKEDKNETEEPNDDSKKDEAKEEPAKPETKDSKENKIEENKEEKENKEDKEDKDSHDISSNINQNIINDNEVLQRALKLIENQLKENNPDKQNTNTENNITSTKAPEETNKNDNNPPSEVKEEQPPTKEDNLSDESSKKEQTSEVKEENDKKETKVTTTPEEEKESLTTENKTDNIVTTDINSKEEQSSTKEEPAKPEEPKVPTITIEKDDASDDDDDDNFNYDNSYINNF